MNLFQKILMIKTTTTSSSDPNKRKMHPSYAGFICGSDTPTNASVGLELSPRLATLVSYDINPYALLDRLKNDIQAIVPTICLFSC